MYSIVIPTFKNHALFLSNLTHNLTFIPPSVEIIIVNDDPEKSLKTEIPQRDHLVLLENSKNLGFSPSVNRGMKHVSTPLALLMNNDVRLINDSFSLIESFFSENQKLFGLGFAQKESTNKIVGKNILRWQRGMVIHEKSKQQIDGPTAWVEAGACAVRTSVFHKLGGFDTLFAPFYWEDIDLSYRARKCGYSVLFTNQITVEHHHESTISKYYSQKTIEEIALRNQFLFIWKNINSPRLRRNHFFHLIQICLTFVRRRKFLIFIHALFHAVSRYVSKRPKKIYSETTTDEELLTSSISA